MELILKHAKHLPQLDNFIINRINKFICLQWHLQCAIYPKIPIESYAHAMSYNHTKCIFRLIKVYGINSIFIVCGNLYMLCACHDNLEILKYLSSMYLSTFWHDTTNVNIFLTYAYHAGSFKCIIYFIEYLSSFARVYTNNYLDTTRYDLSLLLIKIIPSRIEQIKILNQMYIRGIKFKHAISKYLLENHFKELY